MLKRFQLLAAWLEGNGKFEREFEEISGILGNFEEIWAKENQNEVSLGGSPAIKLTLVASTKEHQRAGNITRFIPHQIMLSSDASGVVVAKSPSLSGLVVVALLQKQLVVAGSQRQAPVWCWCQDKSCGLDENTTFCGWRDRPSSLRGYTPTADCPCHRGKSKDLPATLREAIFFVTHKT